MNSTRTSTTVFMPLMGRAAEASEFLRHFFKSPSQPIGPATYDAPLMRHDSNLTLAKSHLNEFNQPTKS